MSNRRRPKPNRPDSGPSPDRLLASAFHELSNVDIGDQLDVEMYVSDLLGGVWQAVDDEPEAEETLGFAMIEYLAKRGDAVAVAALAALRTVSTHTTVRATASETLAALKASGTIMPPWVDTPITVTECWFMPDAFEDVCYMVLSCGGGAKQHGIGAMYWAQNHDGPVLRDAYPLDITEDFAAHYDARLQGGEGMEMVQRPRRVDPSVVVSALVPALTNIVPVEDDDAGETLAGTRALLAARLRGLPGGDIRPEEYPAPAPPSVDEVAAARDEFLASPQSSSLSKDDTVSRLVEEILVFHLHGGKLRVSPGRIEDFLHNYLPDTYERDEPFLEHVPSVMPQFIDWATNKLGIPDGATQAIAGQTKECAGHFLATFDGVTDGADLSELAEIFGALANGSTRIPVKPGPQYVGTHQIRVDIAGAKPPIWRRLEVPSNLPLARLHAILQVAFDWEDSHLHAFEKDRNTYASKGSGLDTATDYAKLRLSDMAPADGDKFVYLYDMGDNWEHVIKVEKVTRGSEPDHITCTAGRRAAPLEDSGGIWGFENLCEAITDPKHPDHAERREWLEAIGVSSGFVSSGFDRDAVNKVLTRL